MEMDAVCEFEREWVDEATKVVITRVSKGGFNGGKQEKRSKKSKDWNARWQEWLTEEGEGRRSVK